MINKKGVGVKILFQNNWIPAFILEELKLTYKVYTQFGTFNIHKSKVQFKRG